jgi:methyl-accepting chemotaxis protein
MKINLPVTNVERPFSDGEVIVSKTDAKGIITYANATFIEISGFTEQELIGTNHNIVRHPDMPPAAFEDLWDTIKAGKPWSGIVKNRCKNGDYYWVHAHVAATYEDGRLTGYVSVRSKPSRAQVEAAAELYRQINDKTAQCDVIGGYVYGRGWMPRMQRFFGNMHLRHKLMMLIALPLAALLYFAISGAVEKFGTAYLLGKVGTVMEFSVQGGDLAHELQKERGMSAGYIASKGAKFGPELQAQRQKTDKAADVIKRAFKTFDKADYPESVVMHIDGSMTDLARLSEFRARVDSLPETAEETIANYSMLIMHYLDISQQISAMGVLDGEIVRVAATYGSMLEFKERDGRERAILNTVFSRDRFTPALLRRFVANAGEEEVYSENVNIYGSPAVKTLLAEKMKEPAAVEAKRIIDYAEGNFEKPHLGVDPVHWFNVATARINLEHDVELAIARELGEVNQALKHKAQVAAVTFVLATLIPIVIVAVYGYFTIRKLTQTVQSIVGQFRRIADGHFGNAIDTRYNDELGEILQALQSMQTKLGFDVNETKRIADEGLRIKNALDNTTTNTMIADAKGRIIYLNKAVIDMFKAAGDGIRAVFPAFDPNKLLGMNIDAFHKNPAHQQQLLASFTTTHRATIKIGNRSFSLAATPVISAKGERLGAAVEWIDITAELKVQNEINTLVNAAAAGDLTQRVALEDKHGFMKKLGEGMNELLEVLAAAMDDVTASLDAMAKGDLTVTITKDYQGTFGKLKDDINTTVSKLTEVVTNIKESADMIRTASSEISMGNTNLSQRTQEQASALEETASSMEQMTSTVKQNADNARQANQLVAGTREQAQSSGEIVTHAVGAMDAITTSSKKIADIIGVIDEIAFQTNLLALNAAVEAARAGEQGRGFAVVATEVRNLAQRSATAAKEIKGLINESVENVGNGTKHVDASGEVLAEISGSVKKISDIVAEIAAASQEQATGIEQVNKAVMQMDEMTQQNAALVEEAAAASKSMEEQAVQLAEQISFFRLSDRDGGESEPGKGGNVSDISRARKAMS